MVEDPFMKEIFPEPPLTAYRRPQSLRDKLIKAKIQNTPNRPQRAIPGAKKCTRVNCLTCPYIIPGSEVKCTVTAKKFVVNTPVTCTTKNIIYCITCNKCGDQYVGETEKEAGVRFSQHRGYVNNYVNHVREGKRIEPTGEHFNKPGHSGVSDMKFQIIEKLFSNNRVMRKTRESMYIKEFHSEHNGINRKNMNITVPDRKNDCIPFPQTPATCKPF